MASLNVKGKIALTAIGVTLQKFVLAIQHIVLFPYFIKAWGVDYYGDWIVLTTIPSMLALSDLGLGSAISNGFVHEYVKERYQQAFDLLKTGSLIIAALLIVAFLFAAIFLSIGVRFLWFDSSALGEQHAITAAVLLGLSRSINIFSTISMAYFLAANKAHVGINITTASQLLQTSSILLALNLGSMGPGVAIIDLSFSLTQLATLHMVGRTLLSNKPIGKIIWDLNYHRKLLKKSLAYLLSPLGQVITNQGSIILLRLYGSADLVTLFNASRTMVNGAKQFMTIVNASVFPEIQQAFANEDRSRVMCLYKKSVLFSLVLGVVATLGFMLFGEQLFFYWLHDNLRFDIILWRILTASLLFNSLWWTSGVVFRAANKPEYLTYTSVSAAAIVVFIAWMFIGKLAHYSPACGLLFYELVMAAFILPASIRLILRTGSRTDFSLSCDQYSSSLKA